MNKSKVTVIDYGLGNLFSVKRALEYCGAVNTVISASPDDIADADYVVLPGVGAFSDGMRGLIERDLVEPIYNFVNTGRPLLGICLGMQMLATQSEEFGVFNGLDLIPGRVVAIERNRPDGPIRKIPYIGWAPLIPKSNEWKTSILRGIPTASSVYLVHSYQVLPDLSEYTLAVYDFDGLEITAAIRKQNVTGVQFHPEKSAEVGLSIIRNFLC
jgi:imidazole glycerol-phosphate synthase subunit HisH